METIKLAGEIFGIGGPGSFYLGQAESLCARFAKEYAGKVQLIYLDPPFGTGECFSMQIGREKKRIPVYADNLRLEDYMAMMRNVLTACFRMLSATGCIYLHVDYRMAPRLRLLLDEIFGEKNFVNEIIWAYKSGGRSTKYFSRKHDNILLYRKSPRMYFNAAAVGIPRGSQARNHMKRNVDENGRIYFSIRSGGKLYKYYEDSFVYPSDVWDDIEHLHQRDAERTGYSTQKPEALLRRIIAASSKEGDLVADFFSGSGTTAAVAAKLGRNWLACDASPLARMTLRARLLKSHSEPSLFDANHEMRLLDLSESSIACEAPRILYTGGAGETLITLTDECPYAYLAAGKAENNFLYPAAYALWPRNGTSLHVPLGKSDTILAACDANGNQSFFQL